MNDGLNHLDNEASEAFKNENSPGYNEALIRGKERRAEKGVGSGPKYQGTGTPNRHGMPKLPPGQHEVKNWPVLDLGVHPELTRELWELSVRGEVEKPFTLDWAAFLALPQVEDVSDFHCVTSWSRMDNHWVGVRFKTLMEKAGLKETSRYVHITSYDGYATNLPLAECMHDDVLLVHGWEGIDLPREHGGPVRMITPRRYAWKGAKWIREIRILAEDIPGFWEMRGYSNTAEPWLNDRYS